VVSEFGTGLRAYLGHEGPAPEPAPEPAPPPVVEAEPPPQPSPQDREIAERLAYVEAAEGDLSHREQRLLEREREAEAALAMLAEEEQRLARERDRLVEIGRTNDIRELMRKRAVQHADLVWASFEDALRGESLELRLLAARTLVGDIHAAEGGSIDDAVDELAQIRQRRTGG
jgi:hypothetical protein